MIKKLFIYLHHYIWFVNKPNCYYHALHSLFRLLTSNKNSMYYRKKAITWCEEYTDNNNLIHFTDINQNHFINKNLISTAIEKKKNSKILMGGAGDINLLYSIAKSIDAKVILETGVAYGFSSLALLCHLFEKRDGILISIDMPYPWRGNESDVGIVVDKKFYNYWNLIRLPDRNGLKLAIKKIGDKKIDIFHYDSDKSYHGRMYAYNLVWPLIKKGGFFISDDIHDNFAFKDFVENNNLNFLIKKFENKYIGIVQK